MLAVKKQIRQLGFTLIELMVVIAIIGLLMAAGLAAYTSTQKTARDARRAQDVRAILAAAEQFKANSATSVYPATIAAMAANFSTGVPTPPSGGTLLTGGSATYNYTVNATNTAFCVCSGMETVGRTNSSSTGAAGVCTFASPGTNNFCLASQQ
jgi:prepilin-type N-terminal cleavage/methylation domain-containing protein